MRSISEITVIFSLLLVACGPGPEEARRELEKLESTLSALAQAPEEDWVARLDGLKEMKLNTEKVSRVRDLCVSSYEAFGEATLNLSVARKKVQDAHQVHANKADAGFEALLAAKEDAEKAVNDVAETLDEAEKLVKECMNRRHQLRSTLNQK